MVSEFMVKGNIIQYTKEHPEANPFELVRPHFQLLLWLLLMIACDSSDKLLVD